jgi:hypothetical protein
MKLVLSPQEQQHANGLKPSVNTEDTGIPIHYYSFTYADLRERGLRKGRGREFFFFFSLRGNKKEILGSETKRSRISVASSGKIRTKNKAYQSSARPVEPLSLLTLSQIIKNIIFYYI